jgi:hypothetical protein
VVLPDWKNNDMVLHVYVPPDFPNAADLFPTEHITRHPNQYRFVQAASPEKAQIMLRSEGNEIVVDQLTSTILEYRRTTKFSLPDSGGSSHLPAVIDGIARFNYFLERRHGSAPIPGVSLEMYRLKGEVPRREPDRSFGDNGNLIHNHEACLLEDDTEYGFKICNTSPLDLFPYLFYFDPDRHTIKVGFDIYKTLCIAF